MNIQHIAVPEAGKDYPRNWNEFLDWFGSEDACLSFLERLRWPRGFVCPSCGAVGEPYRSSRSRLSDRIAPVAEDKRKKRKSRTHQVLVVMAVELLQPKGFGRIRLRRIDNDSAEQVVPFVQTSVEPGTHR